MCIINEIKGQGVPPKIGDEFRYTIGPLPTKTKSLALFDSPELSLCIPNEIRGQRATPKLGYKFVSILGHVQEKSKL